MVQTRDLTVYICFIFIQERPTLLSYRVPPHPRVSIFGSESKSKETFLVEDCWSVCFDSKCWIWCGTATATVIDIVVVVVIAVVAVLVLVVVVVIVVGARHLNDTKAGPSSRLNQQKQRQ